MVLFFAGQEITKGQNRMNILRRGAIALAAVAAVGTGSGLALASSASAAPPVRHVVTQTAITTRTQQITPRVSVINSLDYAASPTAPGFTLAGRTTEVCVTIPHLTPPNPNTILAVCTWRETSVPPTVPATSISGTAFLTGLGQVGRVTSGTGADAGARGFPLSFRSVNIAPRVAANTNTFFTP